VRAVVAAEGSRFFRVMNLAPLRFLGRYSYGLYLSHPIIQDLIVRHVLIPEKLHYQLWESRVAVQVVYTLASTVASVAFAFVLFHAFERHFLSLKRFFPMPTTAPADDRAPDSGDSGRKLDDKDALAKDSSDEQP
jgi:peptidoglycan/LPS O-acetylase OafA/YrhL